MSEQIILASQNKKKLNKDDIEVIQSTIHKTYDANVNSTKQIVFAQKDSLQASIETVSKLYQRANNLKNDLINYQEKMSSIIQTNGHIQKEVDKQKKQISDCHQKIFILKTLQSISQLNKDIEQHYQKPNPPQSLIQNFQELKEKTNLLKMNDFYNTKFQQCQNYFKTQFDHYLKLSENSISFTELSGKIEIITFFELIPSFFQYLQTIIENTFLRPLFQSKREITASENSITLSPQETGKPTSADFIKSSTVLLQDIINIFTSLHLDIPDSALSNYANKVIEMSITLPIGQSRLLNEPNKKLCEIAKIPNVNILDLMKSARLPLVLDKCRQSLKEGKIFGSVIKEMREIMEGVNTDGVLLEIAAMATVIWKNDKMKLQAAIPTLQSIDTFEALQCIMMFDKALNS